MRYVDAGYVVVLVSLLGYGMSLLARRRRLERAVALSRDGAHGDPGDPASHGRGSGGGGPP